MKQIFRQELSLLHSELFMNFKTSHFIRDSNSCYIPLKTLFKDTHSGLKTVERQESFSNLFVIVFKVLEKKISKGFLLKCNLIVNKNTTQAEHDQINFNSRELRQHCL